MVFVTDIDRETAQRLLDSSITDNSRFSKTPMQKVLDSCPQDRIYGLFAPGDRKNAYVMLSVDDKFGPAPRVHELLGFVRGFGVHALDDVRKFVGPFWLMSNPVDDDGRPNTRLRDRFYRKIPWLKEYVLEHSIWGCAVSFFHCDGINVRKLIEFVQNTFGQG